jgi:prepilin-type processing-associated H-X9-DG protein
MRRDGVFRVRILMPDEIYTEQPWETVLKLCLRTFVWTVFVLLAIGVLVSFMLPRVGSHYSAKRMQCNSNLKDIGLAIHNYAQKYGCFPPAYTVDKQGRRMHSWRVLLLEFMAPDLYAQYDFEHPWNSPANLAFAKKMGEDGPYRCPAETSAEPSWTSYVMLVGPTAFSDGPNGRKFKEITDGASNTVMVVEMSPSGILWTAPYDLNVAEMSCKINDPDRPSPRSCHAHDANMVFADGSVQFVSPDEQYLKAITTINGGEDMSKFKQY